MGIEIPISWSPMILFWQHDHRLGKLLLTTWRIQIRWIIVLFGNTQKNLIGFITSALQQVILNWLPNFWI